MSTSCLLRPATVFLALASACLLLFPRPASAGSVTIALNPATLTIVEGSTLTLNFTVTNGTTSTIILTGAGASILGPSGDPSDFTNFPSGPFGAGTCFTDSTGITGIPVTAGGSCTFSVSYVTDNPSGDTDVDSGVSSDSVSTGYCFGSSLANCPGSIPIVSVNFSVTVEDPGFGGQTPEPASLLLLGTGLLGLGPFLRSRLTRS
jgi:hypothetical protein